ncbi:MAG: TlpA family protein disulfide reductase [Saprospiraceae bacterium]
MKRRVVLILLLSIHAFFIIAQENNFKAMLEKCWTELEKNGGDFTERSKCLLDLAAPNFQAKTTTGEGIELTKLRGQVVVLYFFYHSCGTPCDAQIPALNEVVKKYRFEDVKFIALADDSEPELVDAYLREQPFEFKVIPLAQDIIWETFANPAGFPALMVIDRGGKIKHFNPGGPTEKDMIQQNMDKLKTVIDQCLH